MCKKTEGKIKVSLLKTLLILEMCCLFIRSFLSHNIQCEHTSIEKLKPDVSMGTSLSRDSMAFHL